MQVRWLLKIVLPKMSALIITHYPFLVSAQMESDFSQGGAVRVGDSADACGSSNSGAIRFDGAGDSSLDYCNGATWLSLLTSVGNGAILDGGNSEAAAVTIGTNDAFNLNFETSGTTAVTIDTGGNVGVGTSVPTSALHVIGTGRFGAPGGARGVYLGSESSGDVDSLVYAHPNRDIRISSGGGVHLELEGHSGGNDAYLTGLGNFGIGTSSPSQKLDVVGNIRAEGSIIGQVATDADSLTTLTLDFTNTNIVRATGSSAACGTMNITNVTAGGTYTATLLNATETCSTIQLNGAGTNVKLPLAYSGGESVNGLVYSFLYDGLTLWVTYVGY
jgi:hypothetical protein